MQTFSVNLADLPQAELSNSPSSGLQRLDGGSVTCLSLVRIICSHAFLPKRGEACTPKMKSGLKRLILSRRTDQQNRSKEEKSHIVVPRSVDRRGAGENTYMETSENDLIVQIVIMVNVL